MSGRVHIKVSMKPRSNLGFRIAIRVRNIFSNAQKIENIPIIINNFNRLDYLQKQIAWLRGSGHQNIHVIDNNSTFEPLLEYYKKIPADVYFLDRNVGHEALWRTHIFLKFKNDFYVYTDPDVLPCADTPSDFLNYFYALLLKYPQMEKTGFGLTTDDIPETFLKKNEVLNWEKKLYSKALEPGVFHSKIDTSFALYRPGARFQCWETTLRTGAPYLLRHEPWYIDANALSEEEVFYRKSANASASWLNAEKGTDMRYEQ